MSFNTPPTKWIIASAWLATNCFAFNMSSFGFNSWWFIPAALVVTAFHHGYLLRYLHRNPGQAIPRRYIYTYPLLVLLWIAGGGFSIAFGALAAIWLDQYSDYVQLQVTVATLIGGALSLIEAGVVVETWRRCAKLKADPATGALPLGSLDNLERRVVQVPITPR